MINRKTASAISLLIAFGPVQAVDVVPYKMYSQLFSETQKCMNRVMGAGIREGNEDEDTLSAAGVNQCGATLSAYLKSNIGENDTDRAHTLTALAHVELCRMTATLGCGLARFQSGLR